ncbi:pentapeptide repeat-containing protein [Paenibacillus sp. sptzw28]|uniref:pentapeptide repeat-containing protein n=1 Tax=Paenibacillus sp. sptzw28 TaxID=715179 RepID=UPI001C6F0C5B|nr:pentapeptide repeat-containing protein [Paenibacillus sp. sptzw28]QYR19206.1 pentapeptide repeat-containing protein [Paenibacillus sp. sptzw28]
MNEKLNKYLNGVFAPYDGIKSVTELKADLLSDLQERFRELKAEGRDDETAFEMTIDSIGDIEETVQEVANISRSLERQVVTNLSASNLVKSDFAGVIAHKGKFAASALRGSDFTGADLTGSTFASSDVREARFDGANLTDCNLSTLDIANASFNKSILVRTNFSKSGLDGAKFTGVKLTDVTFSMTDLRKTIFENCIFDGVEFKSSDLGGLCFDGQTFIGVKFDKTSLNEVSFKGATLKNVSFQAFFSLTNKYYRSIKTICFDGAIMDKLTYAALKGMGADLSKVTVR